MKVPEKIYIEVTSDGTPYYHDVVKEERAENTNVEYIRLDAFIEKAKKWFKENFMNGHKWEISTYEFENIQSMVDEFRKYMEGE